MSNIVQIVKDVKPATIEDLERVLDNIMDVLVSHFELQKRLSKAPLIIKQWIEDNNGDIESLEALAEEICDMCELEKTVA